jgi:hypothetical protein
MEFYASWGGGILIDDGFTTETSMLPHWGASYLERITSAFGYMCSTGLTTKLEEADLAAQIEFLDEADLTSTSFKATDSINSIFCGQFRPRPYQSNILKTELKHARDFLSVENELKKSIHGCMQLPTGSGKGNLMPMALRAQRTKGDISTI